MLLRSLAAELYKDGRRVTELNEKLLDEFQNISAGDQESGFIYVLQSKSSDERIINIDNLYKIGFSTIPVEERIKNAEQEPTYLLAPVKVIAVYQCYNMNPQKLELLLHSFFGKVCLNLDIYDKNRNRHTPREWFIIPLAVIENIISLIISGEIVNYKYDAAMEESSKIKLN